jgi:hypothetical protein
MFIRGSGGGNEFRRNDHSFYRGIVVKNNDPAKLNRVKVYIPELSNQPYDNWFEEFEEINLKIPGQNNVGDNWIDTKIFEEICLTIPWAEPCFTLFGESGGGRYYKDSEISTISDCNYPEGFETINTEIISLSSGSFSPAFLYENMSTTLGDSFSNPTANFTRKANPYAFNYRPSKYVNKSKGVVGIPNVGSKVWVFHDQGDLNFPVYFGNTLDYRELSPLNNNDNPSKTSSTYPSNFEN